MFFSGLWFTVGPQVPVGVPTLVASAEPREGCPTPRVFTSILNYILNG